MVASMLKTKRSFKANDARQLTLAELTHVQGGTTPLLTTPRLKTEWITSVKYECET